MKIYSRARNETKKLKKRTPQTIHGTFFQRCNKNPFSERNET